MAGTKFIRVQGRVVPVKASGNKEAKSVNAQAPKGVKKPKSVKAAPTKKSKISSGGSVCLLGIHHYMRDK